MQERSYIRDGGEFLAFHIDVLHITVALCSYKQTKCVIHEHVTHVSDEVLLDEHSLVFTPALRKIIPAILERLEEKTKAALPDRVVCITSRQDFLAHPFSYTFLRKNPHEPMSQQELEEYIALSQKKAYDQARIAWTDRYISDPRKMHVMSSSVHALEIDKKMTLHPLGQRGEHVRLSFLYVFCTQGFFDTTHRFFQRNGLKLVTVIPKQIAQLNTFYSPGNFFDDYLILDFGYHYTSVTIHHGGKMQDFVTLPLGAGTYEKLLEHSANRSRIEVRSQLLDVDQDIHPELQEYTDLLISGLTMIFPKLHARVSVSKLYVTGNYAYQTFLDRITKGELSPYIQPGVRIRHGISAKTTPDTVEPIISLFSSQALFSLYRDPIVNIFRSQLIENE